MSREITDYLIDLTEGKLSDNQITSIIKTGADLETVESICGDYWQEEKRTRIFIQKALNALYSSRKPGDMTVQYVNDIINNLLDNIEYYIQQTLGNKEITHRLHRLNYRKISPDYQRVFNSESSSFWLGEDGSVTIRKNIEGEFRRMVEGLLDIGSWLKLEPAVYQKIKHFPPSDLIRITLSNFFFDGTKTLKKADGSTTKKNDMWRIDWINDVFLRPEIMRTQILKDMKEMSEKMSQANGAMAGKN